MFSYLQRLKTPRIFLMIAFWSLITLFLINPLAAHAASFSPAVKTSPTGLNQHIYITVNNNTNHQMKFTMASLAWGEWGQSPVDISAYSSIVFDSMGLPNRNNGTTGWAVWHLEGGPQEPDIIVTWDDPPTGSNSGNIICNPPGAVNVQEYIPSGGNTIAGSVTVG